MKKASHSVDVTMLELDRPMILEALVAATGRNVRVRLHVQRAREKDVAALRGKGIEVAALEIGEPEVYWGGPQPGITRMRAVIDNSIAMWGQSGTSLKNVTDWRPHYMDGYWIGCSAEIEKTRSDFEGRWLQTGGGR